MKSRVFMVCFEAMEPTLIHRWAREGLLPNLAAVLEESVISRFRYDGATENIVTWASMMSGAPPGEHGLWELYGWDPVNYFVPKYDFDKDFPLTPFWVRLGQAGRKAIILDWPRAPLRGGKNVVQVADWMGHYRTQPLRSTRPGLLRELKLLYPDWKGDLDRRLRSNKSVNNALVWLCERIDTKTRFVSERIKQWEWDLFMVHYSEAHDAGHRFWSIHDATHPDHDAEQAVEVGNPLLRIYQHLDTALGLLRENMADDVVFMFYTSTGMGPNYSGNGLLDHFLLKLDGGRVRTFTDRTAFELRNNPASGAIRLNVKNRESKGRIDESSYDDYCRYLAGLLLELVDTHSGNSVVDHVVKCRERYPGRHADELPDMMVVWNRELPIHGFVSPSLGSMSFGDFRPEWTGDHSTNAMLCVSGPGVGTQSRTITHFESFPGFLGSYLDVELGGEFKDADLPGLDVGVIGRAPARHEDGKPDASVTPPVSTLQDSEWDDTRPQYLFRHSYWQSAAGLGEDDLKEALLTDYKEGKPFSPQSYDFFEPGTSAGCLLDFGCGIGRNFQALRTVSDELVAFDLPEMVDACRRYASCDGVILQSDWSQVETRRFDVVVATLVFQHMERPLVLGVLRALARICDFLYVTTRVWADGKGHPNVLALIDESGKFEYVKGTHSKAEALSMEYPSEVHTDILLRNLDPSARRVGNERLFGIDRIRYRPNDVRCAITLAQFFTPNYDHWAYKVLDNKKRYCDAHGYRFHYRRGIYNHAANRHPSWHRIPLLLELLEDPDTEWVFWSDIDSLIILQHIRLEWIMGDYIDKDLIVPNQGPGYFLGEGVADCLCFGHFFIRNSDWSRRFLDLVWDFPNEFGYTRYLTDESWEQEAVNFIYRHDLADFSSRAAVVRNRLFNSFYHTQYRDGDFLVHFAGETARGVGKRERLIDEYGRRVRYVTALGASQGGMV
ncbi:MAG: alkaline phosphatase family protein [Arenicellales bacterium]